MDKFDKWAHDSDGDDFEPPPLWLIVLVLLVLVILPLYVLLFGLA